MNKLRKQELGSLGWFTKFPSKPLWATFASHSNRVKNTQPDFVSSLKNEIFGEWLQKFRKYKSIVHCVSWIHYRQDFITGLSSSTALMSRPRSFNIRIQKKCIRFLLYRSAVLITMRKMTNAIARRLEPQHFPCYNWENPFYYFIRS